MNSDIEQRVARLERKLLVTRALAAVLFASLAIALVVRTKESHTRRALWVSDGTREVRILPLGVGVGDAFFDRRGIAVLAQTKAELLSEIKAVGAYLHATPDGARSHIGVEGVGLDQTVLDGSNVVKLKAYGRVHSEIQIDTETGAWTLVRSVGDPKSNPTETTQLIGPLSLK